MIKALHQRTAAAAILVLVWVCISGCRGFGKQAGQSPSYKFAEIAGQVSEQNQTHTIRRWLFIGSGGQKAAISEIISVTDLWGHKSIETRFLHEYLQDDSLFIFDSGDSTCIQLEVANTGYSEFNLLPLSASWLFFNPGNGDNTFSDTLTICGYSCRKKRIDNGFLWIFGNSSMAIETQSQGITHAEKIIRIVKDTIFPTRTFNHPLGYRELVPAPGNSL